MTTKFQQIKRMLAPLGDQLFGVDPEAENRPTDVERALADQGIRAPRRLRGRENQLHRLEGSSIRGGRGEQRTDAPGSFNDIYIPDHRDTRHISKNAFGLMRKGEAEEWTLWASPAQRVHLRVRRGSRTLGMDYGERALQVGDQILLGPPWEQWFVYEEGS